MERAQNIFKAYYKGLWHKQPTTLDHFEEGKSALIVVDMINGFVREGGMKNPLAEEIVESVGALMKRCKEKGMPIVAFADCHPGNSPEFDSFGKHCEEGTSEVEVLPELQEIGGYTLIPKNSTNGFLEDGFLKWMEAHPEVTDFIVVGVCTDICVMQFVLTLKAWFNKNNRKSRVVIPLDCVETYDAGFHQITIANTMAIFFMEQAGVEIVSEIQ